MPDIQTELPFCYYIITFSRDVFCGGTVSKNTAEAEGNTGIFTVGLINLPEVLEEIVMDSQQS